MTFIFYSIEMDERQVMSTVAYTLGLYYSFQMTVWFINLTYNYVTEHRQ